MVAAGLPDVVRSAGLPDRVTICEVGPATACRTNRRSCRSRSSSSSSTGWSAAGHTVVEATSFVHPKWVPQLADAQQVLAGLDRQAGVRFPVLVPNETGLDRAIEAGAREIAIFGSATETFARRNLNRTVDESIAMFAPVVAAARERGPAGARLPVHVLRRSVGRAGAAAPGRRGRRAGSSSSAATS